MSISTSYRIVRRAVQQFGTDDASQMGAALSYYALFSTAPLSILAVMVGAFVFGQEAARANLKSNIVKFVGPESATEISAWMDSMGTPSGGVIAGVLGGAAIVYGALTIFLHIRQCLSKIWRLERRKQGGFAAIVLNYILAVAMVLCFGGLLLASLVVNTAMPSLLGLMRIDSSMLQGLWHVIDLVVSFGLLNLFFALSFRIMSDGRIEWGFVWYGSLISSILFVIGKFLIGLYLTYSSTASAYGAAGSVVIFLIWVYYSAQIYFFGAELVQARRTRSEWLKEA